MTDAFVRELIVVGPVGASLPPRDLVTVYHAPSETVKRRYGVALWGRELFIGSRPHMITLPHTARLPHSLTSAPVSPTFTLTWRPAS